MCHAALLAWRGSWVWKDVLSSHMDGSLEEVGLCCSTYVLLTAHGLKSQKATYTLRRENSMNVLLHLSMSLSAFDSLGSLNNSHNFFLP